MWSTDGLVLSRLFLTILPTSIWILLLRFGIDDYRPDILDLENRVRPIRITDLRQSYDFIVIGGGSAGSALAARLSEIPHWSVLLLEAGDEEPWSADLPQLYPTLQRGPWDWQYKTEPSDRYCLAMKNQQCLWPRGKVLGGSSVLNAMMYVRGNSRDYDEWAQAGNFGWDYDHVLPYFRKMEDMRVSGFEQNLYHGHRGPLSVETFRFTSPLKNVFLYAANELNMV